MPGTSNFIGELLILCGITYHGNNISMFAAIIGIFLCTIYSMWMYNKVTFLLPKFYYLTISDLFFFEIIILIPLIILMVFLGILPFYLLNLLDYSTHYHFLELIN